ncbi:MAG: type II secretion system F family protein [Verrucomicrobia bacterium]|nr:type II secretion system F family protein [Verrucomicrobiota bacterium]
MFTPARLGHRAEFYRQFASYAEAGVPVLPALDLLAERPPARWLAAEIARLRVGVTQGRTLAESLRLAGANVPVFDIALIEAGEQSGRLDTTFKLLASYYQDRAALIRGVIFGVAYPAVVAHVAVLIFPLSQLIALVTQGAVGLFIFKKLCVLLPVYFAIFFVSWLCQGTRGAPLRATLEVIFGMVPLLGTARRQFALSRLAAALEALINAGVLIIPAWTMAAAATGSPALERAVKSWQPSLQNSSTPAELLRRTHAFPEYFVSLYTSGEVSGKLDESLRRLQAHYQEEGSRKLKIFCALCAGLAYGLVALAVAWQVISFYVGYFNQISDVTDMSK